MKDNEKFKDITLDGIAQMVARGFASVEKRFTSLEARFDALDERLEKIESRLEGAHNRIDVIADMVRPIEQLVPLITKDFYKRFVDVEEKVKHL